MHTQPQRPEIQLDPDTRRSAERSWVGFLRPWPDGPVLGGRAARAALTAYRDAIKSILDQTIQGMKQGERPAELVQHVKLPPPLAENPYLREFYGGVAWTVRGI